jgi:hypothetical protein
MNNIVGLIVEYIWVDVNRLIDIKEKVSIPNDVLRELGTYGRGIIYTKKEFKAYLLENQWLIEELTKAMPAEVLKEAI